MLVWTTGTTAEAPGGSEWLSPAEAEKLASLGSAVRRAEWRLGRCLAKQVAAACGVGDHGRLDRIEIVTDSRGRPGVVFDGQPADLAISISHKRGHAVAFGGRDATRLGCDIELPAPRRPGFAARWLLPSEQEITMTAPDPDATATLIWSAKEATLKALGTGWRRPLSSVEVALDPTPHGHDWLPVEASDHVESRVWSGWWRPLGRNVVTVIADPPPPIPPPTHSLGT